jgi:hypothetical protein
LGRITAKHKEKMVPIKCASILNWKKWRDAERIILEAAVQTFSTFLSRCDRFLIEAPDVGPLRRLRIGHDGKGERAEWHLDRVEVRVNTPESRAQSGAAAAKAPVYTFSCGRWLAKGREDGAIERELLVGGGSEAKVRAIELLAY